MKKKVIISISIILIFLFGFIFGSSYNTNYKNFKRNNNKEKSKYTEMLKTESKTRIIDYLIEKIQENNEIIEVDVMNYLFENIYKNATEIEKINIYSLYFENINNLNLKYYDIINQSGYKDYLRKKINDLNFYDIKDINKLDNETLKIILTEMKVNHFKIQDNNPYLIVNFDYDFFVNEFKDILDKNYIEFLDLENQASKIIINPNYQNINMEGLFWYLINYENFIKNNENEYLTYAAQHIYTQNLGIFFGVSNIGLFYKNEEDGNYEVSDIFIKAYQDFKIKYPDSSTSEIIDKVLPIIENSDAKENISEKIATEIYNYLENCDWIPVKPSEDNSLSIDKFEN